MASAETVATVGAVVHEFPQLEPLMNEHLADNSGEVLPHLFMSDLMRWLVAHLEDDPRVVEGVLQWLDAERARDLPDVNDLIDDSFVEMLPSAGEPGVGIWDMLGPNLRSEARRQGHWPDLA